MPSIVSPRLREWIQPRLYHLLAPLVALLLLAGFAQTPLATKLEYVTLNLRFLARAPFDPPADPRLFLIGIDQQSLDLTGRWPWPRKVEADFLKTVANSQLNPHAIAFDILFTEPSSSDPNNPQDKDLADSAGELPAVITGALTVPPFSDNPTAEREEEKATQDEFAQPSLTAPFTNIKGGLMKIGGSDAAKLPVRPLRAQSFFGFVNDDPSPIDDIRHSLPILVRVNDKIYPSLSLQALCQMLGVDPDKVEIQIGEFVKLKNSSGKSWTIPINDKGEILINYRRESSFRGTSFSNLVIRLGQYVLDPKKYPLAQESDIRNKVLFVGTTAVATTDLGPTPLQAQSPLVYTHLNVVNNVLKNDYLRPVPWYWVVMGWMLVTWPSLLRLKEAPLVEAVAAPIVVILLYTFLSFAIFWIWSIQTAMVWPIFGYGAVNFGGVVLRWVEEQRGRQQIKQLFSRMLSPEVLDHLLAHPENLKLGGSDRPVTVLFSDIRDYTKFSEGLSPSEVVRQLNIYFERMVGCVQEYRGTFHKYIGDAVMSAWGDIAATSLGPEKDAENAVRTALKMSHNLKALNAERKAAHLTPLRIGIGLNHGPVLVGLIGSTSRPEFTVMGDEVNVASRLEGLTKTFQVECAVSESVRKLLGDQFLVRRLGLIQLKGKTEQLIVYEVLADKGDLSTSRMTPQAVATYEAAFDDFLARRFSEAEAGFAACEKEHPHDYCILTYLQASRDFLVAPPSPEWDGRVVMETK